MCCSGLVSRYAIGILAPDRSSLEQSVRNPERVAHPADDDTTAKLLLVVLCIVWGVSWPIMRIALSEVPPFTMRTLSSSVGGAMLLAICLIGGRSLRVPRRNDRWHLVVAGLLNVASFSVL